MATITRIHKMAAMAILFKTEINRNFKFETYGWRITLIVHHWFSWVAPRNHSFSAYAFVFINENNFIQLNCSESLLFER